MIIVRSPYRISLLGGGSDYNEYIRSHGESTIIGMSINKYSYITAQKLDSWPSRFIYKEVETPHHFNEIFHNGIRSTIGELNLYDQSLEIFHASDLGTNLGLGSSSAFLVALCKALSALTDWELSNGDLIGTAVKIEQEYSTVGWQDAALSSLGGLRVVKFYHSLEDKILTKNHYRNFSAQEQMQEFGLLFNLNMARNSSDQVNKYLHKIADDKNIQKIHLLAKKGEELLSEYSFDIERFSELINESWILKRQISDNISCVKVDNLIEGCLSMGAWAAKLCGSGGGGCIFVLADKKYHDNIETLMSEDGCTRIEYKIDFEGCKVLS